MRIALGQFHATTDKAANLAKITAFAAQAASAGADLLVLPECAMASTTDPAEPLAHLAEPLDGPFVSTLSRLAHDRHLAVVAGMYEVLPASAGSSDKAYNTVVALAPGGALLASYRKIHLFDAFGFRESDRMVPGDGATAVIEVGGLRCGLQTCYDVRFPEITRHLVDEGAELIVLPAAWAHGLLKEEQWDVLVRARAIENTCYVAACGQVGGRLSGRSMLVDPMGVAIAAAGEAEALVVGEADGERVRAVRARVPSLQHRRPDVYAGWTQ